MAVEELKLFGKWDWNVEVKDLGLKRYINLKPCVIPKTYGRFSQKRFGKANMNIVERLINKMFGPGHKGKKHLISSAHCAGKTEKIIKIVKEAFEIIEKRTKRNPIEVLVRAIENSAPLEEAVSYQVGGIIARSAVIVSPQRRVDIALRNIVNSCYRRKVNFTKMSEVLAEEIIAAANNDISKSFALKEKERIEREAEGAR
ncbi:MAG: 30S ribosomal protein S7 [Candidatus Aenigmatarchaeota archaeon]